MKRVVIICAVFSLLSTGLAVGTGAEVRVHTSSTGEYERTTIIPGGPPWDPGIWNTRGRSRGLRRGSTVLNPLGDRFGDLVPTITEGSQAPRHPWAVWSRFNGSDYDLVYSSWTYGWSRIKRVTQTPLSGDDLDASMVFSRAGQPLVAWWNRDVVDGHGTVYFSMFLETRWLDPFQISDDSVGGRHPSIEIENGAVVIRYDSDDGLTRMSYQLPMFDPTTITDDIDPQSTFSNGTVNTPKELPDRN